VLSEQQIAHVWENMIAAETRALYFADLAASYTRRKQWITGLTFFLSSGAAVALLAKAPTGVPVVFALIVAAASAYTIAVNLDGKIATMAKLHTAWQVIATQYDQLWNHTWAEDAEGVFYRIVERECDPSELAVAAAPNDEARMAQWQDRVFALRHLNTPA